MPDPSSSHSTGEELAEALTTVLDARLAAADAALVRQFPGDAPDRQPEYWKVELQLVFGEDPAWAALDSLGHQDTGFDYDEIGMPRTVALGEMRRFIESYPQLAAMWRAEPIRSNLTLEQAG